MNRKSKPSTTAESWLQLDAQLCFALYASSLAMTKLYKPLLAPLGLTYPQYLVMLVLWEADGISVSALGQRLSLDSGTLTPLLKRLESAALIARRRATDDERRVDLFLTEGGLVLKRQALNIPPALACASACSPDEIVSLTQRLHDLRKHLSAAISSSSPP